MVGREEVTEDTKVVLTLKMYLSVVSKSRGPLTEMVLSPERWSWEITNGRGAEAFRRLLREKENSVWVHWGGGRGHMSGV